MGKEIILMILDRRVYFNWNLSIPIQNTNIHSGHFNLEKNWHTYIKVEMLGYNADDKCLRVSLTVRDLQNIAGFGEQMPKSVIEKLHIENLGLKDNKPLFIKSNNQIQSTNHSNFNKVTHVPQQEPQHITYDPIVTVIKVGFSVLFSEAHFILGYVTFNRYIKQLDRIVDFKIANYHILAEFDNIKSWFAKRLKTKKFKVSATIKVTENEVSETQSFSKEIDQITSELIDCVKFERTYALSKATGIPGFDKLFFTAEDIFAQLDTGDIEGNVFNQSDVDILNFFVQEKNNRNSKQIEYLACEKQSENQKLRYTLNPNFGYLFMIEGIKHNHFVWELLNSHATYLWRIEKSDNDIELQFKRIETEVNKVRTINRAKYKKAYIIDHQDTDIGFRLISHEDINSNPADNFSKWKNKLNEQLT